MSSKKFKDAHIYGNHSAKKPVNHASDDFTSTKYKSVRESGTKNEDGSSERMKGTKTGQTKVVTREEVKYKQTGNRNVDRSGLSHFMVTGIKNEGKFAPHHLDKKVNKNDDGRYEDSQDCKYSEITESESADYTDSSWW